MDWSCSHGIPCALCCELICSTMSTSSHVIAIYQKLWKSDSADRFFHQVFYTAGSSMTKHSHTRLFKVDIFSCNCLLLLIGFTLTMGGGSSQTMNTFYPHSAWWEWKIGLGFIRVSRFILMMNKNSYFDMTSILGKATDHSVVSRYRVLVMKSISCTVVQPTITVMRVRD